MYMTKVLKHVDFSKGSMMQKNKKIKNSLLFKARIQNSHPSILNSFSEITLILHTNSSDGMIYLHLATTWTDSLSFLGHINRSFFLPSCRCSTANNVGLGLVS